MLLMALTPPMAQVVQAVQVLTYKVVEQVRAQLKTAVLVLVLPRAAAQDRVLL